MQAIIQRAYDPSSLHLADRPVPLPRPDEVLVQVAGAGVYRGVWHMVTGRPLLLRLGTGLRRPRAQTPGSEVAGVVEAVGADVTRFRVGDPVFGVARGAWAACALAREEGLAPAPTAVPLIDAAVLPVSAVAALQAVRAARVGEGSRVLVLGASGGVGAHAVQLAVAAGGVVTAGPYDAITDTGGNRPARHLIGLLAPQGSAVIVGGEQAGGALLGGFSRQLLAPLEGLLRRRRVVPLMSQTTADDLVEVLGLVESGALVPVVDRVLPLGQAAAALGLLEQGAVTGKLVLAP